MVQKWHFVKMKSLEYLLKITKTKVLASFGQIIEVLFSQGKFPLGVSPTSVPEDIAQRAHLDPKNPQQPQEPIRKSIWI